jgi:hypothetical protein
VKKVTILGRLNDVNIQVEMDLDYDPKLINGIDVVKQLTEYWHAGGLEPPVRPGTTARTYSEKVTGANGQHPDDLKPYIWPGTVDPANCPECHKPLYYVTGVNKNKDSKSFGETWVKWFCDLKRGGCGGYNFEPRRDVRYDKK